MEGGGTEDWVNSCSPGLTKAICRVSASITVHCNVQRAGRKWGEEKKMYMYIPYKASVYAEVSRGLIQFLPVSSPVVDCFLRRKYTFVGELFTIQPSEAKVPYSASCLVFVKN